MSRHPEALAASWLQDAHGSALHGVGGPRMWLHSSVLPVILIPLNCIPCVSITYLLTWSGRPWSVDSVFHSPVSLTHNKCSNNDWSIKENFHSVCLLLGSADTGSWGRVCVSKNKTDSSRACNLACLREVGGTEGTAMEPVACLWPDFRQLMLGGKDQHTKMVPSINSLPLTEAELIVLHTFSKMFSTFP